MSAPVLFLDIDGVLNSARWFSVRAGGDNRDGLTREEYQIDPDAVAILNRILGATGAHVVVSSTWRLLHTPTAIHRILRRRGYLEFQDDNGRLQRIKVPVMPAVMCVAYECKNIVVGRATYCFTHEQGRRHERR